MNMNMNFSANYRKAKHEIVYVSNNALSVIVTKRTRHNDEKSVLTGLKFTWKGADLSGGMSATAGVTENTPPAEKN